MSELEIQPFMFEFAGKLSECFIFVIAGKVSAYGALLYGLIALLLVTSKSESFNS